MSQHTNTADRQARGAGRSAAASEPTGGFTRSELDLIHATAEAYGTSICICTAVLPDDTFPPAPGGGPRPEVARILNDLRHHHDAAGTGAAAAGATRTRASRADRSAGRATPTAERPAASTMAAAYDRQAYDLAASRLAADAHDAAGAAETELDLEAGRG